MSQNSLSSLLYKQNSAAGTLPLQETEGVMLVFLSFLALASSLWQTVASSVPPLAVRS